MIFIDTNYFLRFILKDNQTQYLEAKRLFLEAARGEIELTSSSIVFFEIHFVLKSYYGKDKKLIVDILSKILNLNIFFPEKKLLQASLSLLEHSPVGLEDCHNLICAKILNVEEFKTFDIKLNKEFKKLVGKKKAA